MLSGCEVVDVESAKKAASVLIQKGCGIAIITLGANGCVYAESEGKDATWVKADAVKAVDTTVSLLLVIHLLGPKKDSLLGSFKVIEVTNFKTKIAPLPSL